MKGWILAVFGLALLAGSVFADETTANATKLHVLNLKYGLIECRVNAVISLVQYGENNTNTSSSGLADKLAGDLSTLKGYSDRGDRQGFNDFVKGELRNDLRDATLYLKGVRKEIVKGGKNRSSASDGQNYFVQVRQDRAKCLKSVALDFAKKQVNEVKTRVNGMKNTTAKLKAKGVDTSEMDKIMGEAEANLDELRDAEAKGNASTIQETVKGLREEHLHIWARFQIAKMKAIVDATDDEAISKGYQSDVTEISALLDDASSKVKIGRVYNPGDFEYVKSALKQAHEKMKNLLKKMRGA